MPSRTECATHTCESTAQACAELKIQAVNVPTEMLVKRGQASVNSNPVCSARYEQLATR